MLKIKLMRIGKKNQPYYRIIVAEDRSKRNGKHIAILGTYNPLLQKDNWLIDLKSYQSWIDKGAQPTQTVKKLVSKTS